MSMRVYKPGRKRKARGVDNISSLRCFFRYGSDLAVEYPDAPAWDPSESPAPAHTPEAAPSGPFTRSSYPLVDADTPLVPSGLTQVRIVTPRTW